MPSGMQTCMQSAKVKKEKNSLQRKREGTFQGEGALLKNLKIQALPPKWPSSGVTFHNNIYFYVMVVLVNPLRKKPITGKTV